MPSPFARVRLAGAVVLAFVCGLVLASGLNLTRYGYAQTARPAARDVKSMTDASNAFVSIAEHVTPAVVSIQTQRDPRRAPARPRSRTAPPGMDDFFRQFDPRAQQEPIEASGSGFITSKDGYILTNNHVVADADRVQVTLTDHRVFKARVIGRDPDTDIAVIKIDGSDLPTVSLGDDAGTRIGEWVLAIGNPLGLDFTVTAGIVSAKGRGSSDLRGLMNQRYAISDFIQTDAAINPGNSGGPLVNGQGEVIGINSAIASPTGYYSGYGFAIPVTLARNVMDQLIKYGRVRRAILGVAINEVQPEDAQAAGLKTIAGVKVDSYNGDGASPAQKAGVQIGDIITSADGRTVDKVSTLQRIVRTHMPGETIEVTIARLGGERKTLKITLAEPPNEVATTVGDDAAGATASVATDKLGIAVEAITPAAATQLGLPPAQTGLRVVDVEGASPAHSRLFPNGDVITEILYPGPRRAVRSVAEFEQALGRLKGGDVISVIVVGGVQDGAPQSRVVSLRVGG